MDLSSVLMQKKKATYTLGNVYKNTLIFRLKYIFWKIMLYMIKNYINIKRKLENQKNMERLKSENSKSQRMKKEKEANI